MDGIDAVKLIATCPMFPEQYDAYMGAAKVGYLRLRGGEFRVDCPDCGGETVYKVEPEGEGCFEPNERERYLNEAKRAVLRWVHRERWPK